MARRYQEHLGRSSKCKYTRSFPVVKIAACWELHAELSLVLKAEHLIKKLSKAQKQFLIEHPAQLKTLLLDKGYEADEVTPYKKMSL